MEDDDEFGDLYTDVLRPLTALHPPNAVVAGAAASFQSRTVDPDINSDDEEILHGAADLKNPISCFSPDPCLKSNASIQVKTLPGTERRPEPGGFNMNFDSNSKASKLPGGDGLGLEATTELPTKDPSGLFNFTKGEDDLNIVMEEGENKDDGLFEQNMNSVDIQEKMQVEHGDNMERLAAGGEAAVDQTILGISTNYESYTSPNFAGEWESDDSEDDLQIVLNDNHQGPIGMERMPGADYEDDDEEGDQLVIVADNGDIEHLHQPMLGEREVGAEEGGTMADGERKESGDASKAGGIQPKIGYSNHMYHHYPFHSQFKYVRPGAAPLPGEIQGQVRPTVAVVPGAGRGRGEWRPRGPVPMQKGLHPGYGMPSWGPITAGRGYGSGLDFTLPSHKTIFEVDIDGFEEKPWRLPGIDLSDFFNFGLNEESWKDYCKQLEQLRLETTMQSKIRVYESGRMEQDYDPDLPPELAAAVGNQGVPSENGNTGTGEAGPSDSARASARAPPPVPVGRPIPVETGSGDRLPSIDTRRPRMHDSDAIIEIVCQSSNDEDDLAEQDNDLVGQDVGGVDDIDPVQGDDTGHIDRSSPAYNAQTRDIVARKELPVKREEAGREGDPRDERYTKGKGQVKSPSKTNPTYHDDGEKQVTNNELFGSENGKQNRPLLSDEGEPAVAIYDDDANGDYAMDDDKSIDTKREGDARENDDRENEKFRVGSRSRHDGDIQKDRVLEDRPHRPHLGVKSNKRVEEDDDSMRGRGHQEREDSHSLGGGTRRHASCKSTDHWRKTGSERDNGNWRGPIRDRDVGSRSKDRDRDRDKDDLPKKQPEKEDDAHSKRRKDGVHTDRGRGAEKEDKSYNHNSRRKRERDDTHAKSKDEDTHYDRHKEVTRPGEDKKRIGHSRDKDDHKGSGREYHSKNVGRHGDQLKRRDRAEGDSISRSRGREDSHTRGNRQGSKDEKRAGYERPSPSVEREAYASDISRQHEHNRRKVGNKKGKEFPSGEHSSVNPSEGNYNDGQSGQMSEMADLRAKTEQSNPEPDRQPSRKDREEASSDDEQQAVSKRGRSKFERWTSQQERDLTKSSNSSSSVRNKTNKDKDTPNSGSASLAAPLKKVDNNKPELSAHSVAPSIKVENNKPELSSHEKDTSPRPAMSDNKHMDTVEKLKKRSERFKLPMLSTKEAMTVKKMESEALPSAQTETEDLVIKPERPARKRRWTGN